MCGIIGVVGQRSDPVDVLLDGLSNLEYRGYDSAGVAVSNGSLRVVKREGELENLEAAIDRESFGGHVGIGHTRWSTHGPPSDRNAHPHTDADERVAVVHNGIIENYDELREELVADGYTFRSDTDTEVVPHLVARELDAGSDPETAFRTAIDRIEGSYAIACVVAGTDAVFAVRHDSPLVLGIAEDAYYLGSDVPAFLEYTSDVVYLEDGQFATLEPASWRVTDAEGTPIEADVATVDWDPEETAKSGYDHFMLKEINEQPAAIRQCLSGRVDELGGRVELEELDSLPDPERVHFVACGTSYHAALYATELYRGAGVPASVHLASEYATSPPPIPDGTLVVGVTQSGETADTLSALREAKSRNTRTLALTNVVDSTAARECDHVVYIRAGPEIGVAATKTFASQQVAVNLLVEATTGRTRDIRQLLGGLRDLPGDLQTVLDTSRAEAVVEEYIDSDASFFIGRGYDHPVALEGALKFKEITYEHAEGFPAGELKHGPLALVTANTPVFAIVTGGGQQARKTVGNVKEVEARDAPVVAVTDGRSDVARYADDVLSVPESHPRLAPILANVQLQLVAYHTAAKLGRSIDKPRNLAKSVTVE
jgi:glucosamine--fructose-6-phosphate aminotransferase (isomerizing)